MRDNARPDREFRLADCSGRRAGGRGMREVDGACTRAGRARRAQDHGGGRLHRLTPPPAARILTVESRDRCDPPNNLKYYM